MSNNFLLYFRWRVKSKRDILGFIVTAVGDNVILHTAMFGYHVRLGGIDMPDGSRQICVLPNLSTSQSFGAPSIADVEAVGACRSVDERAIAAAHSSGPRLMTSSVIVTVFAGWMLLV